MKGRQYLLDTHIFIWSIYDENKLSTQLYNELQDKSNILYLSKISLIEIALKNKIGKLRLKGGYKAFVSNIKEELGIKILEIEEQHLITFNQLTCLKEHNDPFDHIIISQAITDRLCLISADSKMLHYINQGLDLLFEKR